jgi:hypothetical protein
MYVSGQYCNMERIIAKQGFNCRNDVTYLGTWDALRTYQMFEFFFQLEYLEPLGSINSRKAKENKNLNSGQYMFQQRI